MRVTCWCANDQTDSPAISCCHPHEQKDSYSTKIRSSAGTRYLLTLMLHIRHSCSRGMVSIFEADSCMHANTSSCQLPTHTLTHKHTHVHTHISTPSMLPHCLRIIKIEGRNAAPPLQLSLLPLSTPHPTIRVALSGAASEGRRRHTMSLG